MLTKKDKDNRNNYCFLEERATVKAIHRHYRIADLLERWASKVAREYRTK